jgi:hypothetical protein
MITHSASYDARAARPVVERLETHEIDATIARLDGLAKLLDGAVRIPGTDVRVGVDALIGLVPVVGDLVGKAISGYLILEARRLGVSNWTIARMAANTTVDTIVGVVPIVGDVFDVMFRANQKNIALLKAHIAKHGVPVAGGRVLDGRAHRVG